MIKQTVKNQLNKALSDWAKGKGLETLPQYSLEEPPKNIGGDLSTNIAMLCAKLLKSNPRKIAEELSPLILNSLKGYAGKVDIAGAGFLNITFSSELLTGELEKILSERANFGRSSEKRADRLLFEFVSANPTGPLHIGHGAARR